MQYFMPPSKVFWLNQLKLNPLSGVVTASHWFAGVYAYTGEPFECSNDSASIDSHDGAAFGCETRHCGVSLSHELCGGLNATTLTPHFPLHLEVECFSRLTCVKWRLWGKRVEVNHCVRKSHSVYPSDWKTPAFQVRCLNLLKLLHFQFPVAKFWLVFTVLLAMKCLAQQCLSHGCWLFRLVKKVWSKHHKIPLKFVQTRYCNFWS